MSAPLSKDQFAFELPNLTYVDTHLEDPVLPPITEEKKPYGVHRWLAAFRGWRENWAAMAEMDMMSDRELADIGLSRSDLPRVFDDNFNGDLRARAAA
jgi:uncharacterized protein YjiS (DUF1127 family)